MIGTIRKHSNWLWYPIIIATIITFVLWGASQALFGTRSGGGNLGTVYGKKVTPEQYVSAKKYYYLSYWFGSGHWPDDAAVSPDEIERQIYVSLLITQKAHQLGIHVSEDAAAISASERLAALGRNGQSVPLDALVDQALAPKGFTAADFENYVRDDLAIHQLVQTLGLPGELITPQEARAAYQRENEELSCQAVFFSGSNYLNAVSATPGVVGQFYTNYQAQYRLPDRVQINYVVYSVSNYLSQSRAEWAKTNLSDNVDAYLHKVGENYKGSKNATEARAKITEELVTARAQADARKAANELAAQAFAMDPVKPENLATVANQKGLILHQTAPFAKDTGPEDIAGAVNFTKAAFELTSDTPLAGPITDGDGVYVIALDKTLPSEIPSYDKIRFQVAMDYERRESTLLAQRAGMAFYQSLTNQIAAGHSFASVAVGAGYQAEVLPPFSISTQELPELGERASLGQIKQAAFTTAPGKPSGFVPTQDGGFILLVQSRLPVDQAKLTQDLPQFTQNLRRSREGEAFNQWLQAEASANLQIPK
jgi:parvulin-like peptidyl-prolyl isomerase